jgi:hypothetical protein
LAADVVVIVSMRAFRPLVAIVALMVPSLSGTGQPSVFAQTQSDRTSTVLAAARAALGGDARIAGVKTFIATGRTRQLQGENLIPIEFEIQAELPDRFARRDEFPAQDNGPATTGFNGDALVQIPPAPSPPARVGAPPATPAPQEAARRGRVEAAKQDFARLMLGMFASSYSSFPVTFAYEGQAEAPQGKADVIDVTGPASFRARLFISSESHLPIMLTWQAPAPPARRGGPSPGAPSGVASPPPVEQRMYFADYRQVDGLQLPFRIRRAVDTATIEETTFDRFRINARIDLRRFETKN